jgi:enterochelin esterase-like enzyme
VHQLVTRPVDLRPASSQPGGLRPVAIRSVNGAASVMSRLPTHGEIVSLKIPAFTSGFVHRAEYVWLPPAWFTVQRPQLGVLVMLAGTPGQPSDWLRATNATAVADAWAAAHQGVAPILVFADGNGAFTQDTECVDGPRGRAETYLVKDLRSYVIARFGADPAASAWGIIGLSEGGTCAADLTLRHPEAFRTFVDLAGDLAPNLGPPATTIRELYGGNAARWRSHDLLGLLAARHRDGTARSLSGWFAAGRSDLSKLRVSERLARAARSNGLATRFATNAGGHSFRSWTAALPRAFAWAAPRVGARTLLVAARSPTSETRANLASAAQTRVKGPERMITSWSATGTGKPRAPSTRDTTVVATGTFALDANGTRRRLPVRLSG